MRFLLSFALAFSVIAQTSKLDKPVEKKNAANLKTNGTENKKQDKPLPTVQGGAVPNQPTATHQEDDHTTPPDNRIYKVEVEKVPPDYWMRVYVIVNGLIAAFGLGTLWFIRHQRDVMKEQLAEMKRAGEQTDSLIVRASDQVSALTVAAAAADKGAQAAKDTVNAMIQSMRLEQRAWVSVGKPHCSGLHTGSTRLIVRIEAENTGRTPAKQVAIAIDIAPVEAGREPVFHFNEPTGCSAVIFPNGEYATTGVLNFTAANLERIMKGEIVVWVYGKVVYQDIFYRGHWTKFCFFMNVADQSLTAHTKHNDIDQDADER